MYMFLTLLMQTANIQFFSCWYSSVAVMVKLTMLQDLDGQHGECFTSSNSTIETLHKFVKYVQLKIKTSRRRQ